LGKVWTAGLAVIGDEILSGRTQDKNIAQVATWLNAQGIRLAEVRVVPDVEQRIIEAIDALRSAYDYCFTTGGIGPTHDDITVDAVAKALGVPVVVHPDAKAILERYYADKGGLNEGRLRMARVPQSAELIPNRMSGAPGIRLGNLFLMAGVPHITAGMLDALSGKLEGGKPLVSVTVGAFAPESEVAEMLREAEQSAEGISIGSYPFFKDGRVGSNFVVRSEDRKQAQMVADDLAGKLAGVGYDPVAGGI
jgi:molybdenum cofactor synthesis domain-containing protein